VTKIVVTGPDLPPPVMERARSSGANILSTGAVLSSDDLASTIARERPDGIIVRFGPLPKKAIDASDRLRIVAKHGVGYDNIDLSAATNRGVPVTITEGANAQSVAEHALGLMLSVARRIPWLDHRIRLGHWDKSKTSGLELAGKTLGIVGAGSIGRTFGRAVVPLGMPVLAYDPFIPKGTEPRGLEMVASLDQLLERSDVVSLHCPLTAETANLISVKQFELMRPDAILINTARGGLVDIDALTNALETRRIFGAGLDTFTVEPTPKHSRLWALPNLVITPHIGGTTREAALRVGSTAVKQVLDWMRTGRITDGRIVNPDFFRALSAGGDRS
jgi:D-3-phosphoglycerate dehydrogenase